MHDMNPHCRHERLGMAFLAALREGDPAALADLWAEAEGDPELGELFEQLLDTSDTELPPLPTVSVRHCQPTASHRPGTPRAASVEGAAPC